MSEHPDVLWIYCDQLRADALACYGHPSLRLSTPSLDRLAAGGARFTQAFCNSPVCVPSRMCSLTGLYPEESGVYNNEAAWRRFRMPRNADTLPEVFARHGYRTANFGKIHVARGFYPGDTPPRNIFQFHDGTGAAMNFWQPVRDRLADLVGEALAGVWPDDLDYPPDQQAGHALAWLESATSPWFVRISLLQPHRPVLPPARCLAVLAGQRPRPPELPAAGLSRFEALATQPPAGRGPRPARDLELGMLHYHAQVAWVDSQVGRVLDWLEARGRLTRTLVVFQADHGVYLGEYGALGGKHTFAPCVHRVPLILSWPSVIPPGAVRGDLCDSLDVTRTMLELAGLEPPPQFRGRHLFRDPAPDAIFATIGYGQPTSCRGPNAAAGRWPGNRGWPRRSCIRTAGYRLDQNMLLDGAAPDEADRDVFLADALADPLETINRAADPACAGVVRNLSDRLARHAAGALEVPPESLLR